jgi:hypothetical protein
MNSERAIFRSTTPALSSTNTNNNSQPGIQQNIDEILLKPLSEQIIQLTKLLKQCNGTDIKLIHIALASAVNSLYITHLTQYLFINE